MKRKTIIGRRTRSKAKGSSYAEKKVQQNRGIFRPESSFMMASGFVGITLQQFKQLKYRSHGI